MDLRLEFVDPLVQLPSELFGLLTILGLSNLFKQFVDASIFKLGIISKTAPNFGRMPERELIQLMAKLSGQESRVERCVAGADPGNLAIVRKSQLNTHADFVPSFEQSPTEHLLKFIVAV